MSIFSFSVTVTVILVVGSKKSFGSWWRFCSLRNSVDCSEGCGLAFTAINEWMTFTVVLIHISNSKSFVFEARAV